jgi:hypothetical protein
MAAQRRVFYRRDLVAELSGKFDIDGHSLVVWRSCKSGRLKHLARMSTLSIGALMIAAKLESTI